MVPFIRILQPLNPSPAGFFSYAQDPGFKTNVRMGAPVLIHGKQAAIAWGDRIQWLGV